MRKSKKAVPPTVTITEVPVSKYTNKDIDSYNKGVFERNYKRSSSEPKEMTMEKYETGTSNPVKGSYEKKVK